MQIPNTFEQIDTSSYKLSDNLTKVDLDKYSQIVNKLGYGNAFEISRIRESQVPPNEDIYLPATQFRAKEVLDPQLDANLISLICLILATKEITEDTILEAFEEVKNFLATSEGLHFIEGIYFAQSDNSIQIMVYSSPLANEPASKPEQQAA